MHWLDHCHFCLKNLLKIPIENLFKIECHTCLQNNDKQSFKNYHPIHCSLFSVKYLKK